VPRAGAPAAPDPPDIEPSSVSEQQPAAPIARRSPERNAPRAPSPPITRLSPDPTGGTVGAPEPAAPAGEMAESLAVAFERLRARVEQPSLPASAAPPQARAPHKHSMSLIARTRLALRRRAEQRKQRRAS
jgi:hypothetical protein